MLEADLPEDAEVDAQAMATARQIIEERVNGLGVTEPLVQLQGSRRIIVELPGLEQEEQAISTIRETGLMEFIDTGDQFLAPGSIVQTDYVPGMPIAEAPVTPQMTAEGRADLSHGDDRRSAQDRLAGQRQFAGATSNMRSALS